jgi:type IV pilus assembly protein PilA
MKRVKLMEKVKLKKKAFTLIELLAVIVILAIILAIAVPTLTTMFGSSSKNTFEANAKMVIKDLEYKIAEDRSFNPSDINETNIESVLDIDDNNYKSVTVKDMNDVLYVTIVGKNKWDKLTVSGTKSITKATDTVTSFVRGANAPVLAPNMKPIKWNGTTWTDVAESDTMV